AGAAAPGPIGNETARSDARRFAVYMHEAWAMTTASRPCICSCDKVEGSSRLPPCWVAALDLRMPTTAAARLSAGTLADMQSHILCDPVTRHSFMNSSWASAAPDTPKTLTTRPTESKRIESLPENSRPAAASWRE